MEQTKPHVIFLFLLAWFFFFCCPDSNGEMYKWEDENGNIHFSDCPPAEAESAEVETLGSIEAAPYEPGDSGFLIEEKYLYYPDAKKLTKPQKRKIEQNYNYLMTGGRRSLPTDIWFTRIKANDYTENLWLLDIDLFCVPKEITNRLWEGYAMTLNNHSPKQLDSPNKWPSYYMVQKYFYVTPPAYLHSNTPPNPSNFPFFANIDWAKEYIMNNIDSSGSRNAESVRDRMLVELLECFDCVSSEIQLQNNPLEYIRFYGDSFDAKGAPKMFRALTLKKKIQFKKESGQWNLYSSKERSFDNPDGSITDRMTRIPASQKTTTLTEESALELCLPALKIRLRNIKGRIFDKVKKTEFRKYPGTEKAELKVVFFAKFSGGYGRLEQTAHCTFVNGKITDLDL